LLKRFCLEGKENNLMSKLFDHRIDAGRQLASELHKSKRDNVIVLALPRGGVGVAAEVAKAFKVPIELLFVRKLGAPFNPELGVGAVVEGATPQTFLNEDLIKVLKVSPDFLKEETERQLHVIQQQQQKFRSGNQRPVVAGKSVILIDDGIATGATVQAALKGLKNEKPKRLTLAVPVAPLDVIQELSREVDEVVCLHQPQHFQAVGQFFREFPQLQDEEVKRLMSESRSN
jgi:putative phosphoribosyl transferase